MVRSLQNSLARRTAMTAGKRRELRALEEDLEAISRSEPVQLLEEERLRKEIAELRAKIERVRLSTPLIYATKITKNGRSLPARR
ncbi:UPF0229 protein YeaH [Klebsiella pneumoniae IS43]|uniref:UPF0229 protein YeaH n=1 Tax=Klebsiella pneumoniae IS43 TaxID=1432552 RepID=W1DUD6_KLEPN|nr:UPF0229 protein YeaH [Klebsiella pneumoniae IS43]